MVMKWNFLELVIKYIRKMQFDMTPPTKKTRGKNFSTEETSDLINLVAKERDIIENKQTNSICNKEKATAWNKIKDAFNRDHPLNQRTTDQLNFKYENLKSFAKKYAAQRQKELTVTGNGAGGVKFDPILESVLEIIKKKTVQGESNGCDDDLINLNMGTNTKDDILGFDSVPSPIIDKGAIGRFVFTVVNEPSESTVELLSPQENLFVNDGSKSDNVVTASVQNTIKNSIKKTETSFYKDRNKNKKHIIMDQLAEAKSKMYLEKKEYFHWEAKLKKKEVEEKEIQIAILREQLEDQKQSRSIRLQILKEELQEKQLNNLKLKKSIEYN